MGSLSSRNHNGEGYASCHEGSSTSSHEGHEGDEKEEGYEGHGSHEGHEGHEGDAEEGCHEAPCHEGSSTSGHEGHEGDEGHEMNMLQRYRKHHAMKAEVTMAMKAIK